MLRICFTQAFLFCTLLAFPQGNLTRGSNGKWGVSYNGKVVSAPVFDTVFDFDKDVKVCMGCFKKKVASANKFIKVFTTTYACNYLDASGKLLKIKVPGNDTCSVFGMTKNSVQQKNSPGPFQVSVNNRRFLVSRDFVQLSFKGHHDIRYSAGEIFFIIQELNDADAPLTGLADLKENIVVPCRYSDISVNTADSLIIACSAGVRINGEDEVFGYDGKKRYSHHRHIQVATRRFMVQKVYEPHEHYVVYTLSTKEEKPVQAEEIRMHNDSTIMVRQKKDWFYYHMPSGKRIEGL